MHLQTASTTSAFLGRRAAQVPLGHALYYGLCLEAIFYGLSAILYAGSLWSLRKKSATGKANKLMAIVSTLLFLLSTAHIILNVARMHEALLNQIGRASLYLADISNALYVASIAAGTIESAIADVLLVYRVYVVWGRQVWVIVVPGLLLLAQACVGCILPVKIAFAGSIDALFASELSMLITSIFSLTLATNVLCTALLAYRIQKNYQLISHTYTHWKSSKVALIVVESGALFSVSLILQIIFHVLQSNIAQALFNALPSILAISFYLIIIRVGLGVANNGPPTRSATLVATQSEQTLPLHHIRTQSKSGVLMAHAMHGHDGSASTLSFTDVPLDTTNLDTGRRLRAGP